MKNGSEKEELINILFYKFLAEFKREIFPFLSAQGMRMLDQTRLWIFEYDKRIAKLYHSILYPDFKSDKEEVYNLLENMAIYKKGGTSAYIVETRQIEILNSTFRDPRGSVGDIDLEIGDFSWIGAPFIVGDEVKMIIGFYLPVFNAFTDKESIEKIVRSLINNYYDYLYFYWSTKKGEKSYVDTYINRIKEKSLESKDHILKNLLNYLLNSIDFTRYGGENLIGIYDQKAEKFFYNNDFFEFNWINQIDELEEENGGMKIYNIFEDEYITVWPITYEYKESSDQPFNIDEYTILLYLSGKENSEIKESDILDILHNAQGITKENTETFSTEVSLEPEEKEKFIRDNFVTNAAEELKNYLEETSNVIAFGIMKKEPVFAESFGIFRSRRDAYAFTKMFQELDLIELVPEVVHKNILSRITPDKNIKVKEILINEKEICIQKRVKKEIEEFRIKYEECQDIYIPLKFRALQKIYDKESIVEVYNIDTITFAKKYSFFLELVFERSKDKSKGNIEKNNIMNNTIKELEMNIYKLLSLVYKEKTEEELKKSILKNAIISILVDSFAHNISAHSLAALQWWIRLRSDLMSKKFEVIDKELKIEETLKFNEIKKIKENLGAFYSKIDKAERTYRSVNEITVLDIINFLDSDNENRMVKFLRLANTKADDNSHIGFTIPIDYAMWRFLQYLRNKAGFWSGITKDKAFGGIQKSFHDILWEDFACNSLFLGTIAASEGVGRLILKVKVKDSPDNPFEGEYAVIDLTVVDIEKRLLNKYQETNNNTNKNDKLPGEKPDSGQSNDGYSPYRFVRPGKDFHKLMKILSGKDFEVYLPGGVVGEHALFTMIENTLRNVKHYKGSKDFQAKEDGLKELHMCISIKPKFSQTIKKPDDPFPGEQLRHDLFSVGIWLDHEIDLIENENGGKRPLLSKLDIMSKESIVDFEGNPKLGGTYQDKICAAFLFSNEFTAVDNNFPLKDGASWVRIGNIINGNDYFIDIYSNEEKEFNKNALKDKNGKEKQGRVTKYIFIWKGDFYTKVDNKKDVKAKDKNISRFKMIIIDIKKNDKERKELFQEARKRGIIRILYREHLEEAESNYKEIEDIEKELYQKWLIKFLANLDEQTLWIYEDVPTKDGEKIPPQFFVEIKKDKNKSDGLEKILLESDVEKKTCKPWHRGKIDVDQLVFAHGQNKNPRNIIDYRTHGVLFEKFTRGKRPIFGDIGEINEQEFLETLLTQICIFDNRIYNRVSKEKIQLLKEKLALSIYKEDKVQWMTHIINKKSLNFLNFLIVHLSFIEELYKKKYKIEEIEESEDIDIPKILEKELGITKDNMPSNFIFVITTGRSREKWLNIVENTVYSTLVFFKPIEDLLSAVEDGVSLKDDFKVKYNLMKVLLGS